jgi:hypothetical protein
MRIPHPGQVWLITSSLTFALSISSATRLAAAETRDTLPDSFLELADLRATNAAQLAQMETQIRTLEDSLPLRLAQATTRSRFQEESLRIAKLPVRTHDQEEYLGYVTQKLVFLRLTSPEAVNARIAVLREKLDAKRQIARAVQDKLTSLLNPHQEFKRTMSMLFGILIGVVILGFFVLAFKDPKVRTAIFGGQAGMQFLTLFSLVIAIILFGITGILEGKELGALLGGLSGYILGRSSQASSTPPAT